MKLNISYPQTGKVKTVEIDDEKRLVPFYDRRIGAEVSADTLGPEWKGYKVKITGGNDKQGFPMLQGILCNHRVRILMKKGMKCFRERRKGTAKRKSVRGCIVGSDISALNLIVVSRGENEIEGFTDVVTPRRLGPKRASKIRKLFGLSPEDDVRKFVVRRVVSEKKAKAPKIQRLVTAERLARKAAYKNELCRRADNSKKAAEEFQEVLKAYKQKKLAAMDSLVSA